MTESNETDITPRPKRKKKAWYFFLIALMFVIVLTAVSRLKPGRETGESPAGEAGLKPQKPSGEFVVATTTSLYDSGLLDNLLPIFEQQTGFKVKLLAVGTGEALEMGRRQVADLLLVHSAELEKRFMDEGYGWRRVEFMASDFVMAGPASDAAGIRGLDFPEAFRVIAAGQFPFVSRADNSGTHNLEIKIWAEIRIKPEGRWYLETGQGMGASLQIASEKQAYILTDFPTFCRLESGLNLEVLTRDERYENVYSAISVKNITGKINVAAASALMDFLLSEEAQKIIAGFGRSGKADRPLFRALTIGGYVPRLASGSRSSGVSRGYDPLVAGRGFGAPPEKGRQGAKRALEGGTRSGSPSKLILRETTGEAGH